MEVSGWRRRGSSAAAAAAAVSGAQTLRSLTQVDADDRAELLGLRLGVLGEGGGRGEGQRGCDIGRAGWVIERRGAGREQEDETE